jgi:PASTA domain
MAIGQVTVPHIGGYNSGVGADFATGSPMGKVVDGVPSPVDQAAGSVVEFQVQRIQSTEELEQALGIDAEASYGSGSFGVSARFSFAKKQKVQSSSLFMSVTCHVELEFLSIDDPILSQDAQTLVNSPEAFTARYGNVFVRGIGRGGLFVGTLRMETGSSEESQQIAAELQGSYGLFSADAKLKFDNLQKKYRTSTFFDMYHEGGPVDLKIKDPTNPMELLENANSFLDSFKTDPSKVARPYFVTLAPVPIARGAPPPNSADLEHAQDVLVACAKARSRVLDKINLLEYILDNSSKFDFPADTDRSGVQKALEDFQADLDLIADCASAAIRSPAGADMPALYAQKNGKVYPRATLPDNLPLPKSAKMVDVPDFTGCQSWVACNEVATQAGLVAEQTLASIDPGDQFKVKSVSPPTGTSVPEGTKVEIITQPAKVVVKPLDGVFLTGVTFTKIN